MTNAITVPDTFTQGKVAAVFQGQAAGDDLSGGVSGGYGLIKYRGKVWSIQHNGNSMTLMRDDGDGPRGSIDIVILKANPLLSKTFYDNGWDENSNNPPDCASADGIRPDNGVPKKQADVCALCPRNAWGSAPGGGRGKACGDHRRLAVVPLTDLKNEMFGGPLLLRVPAASLQDLAAFDAKYKSLGYPYFTMGIKVSFNPQESFPKFVLQAIRPLSDAEAGVVMEMRNSSETARVINETVVSAPVQAAPVGAQGAFLEAPPANAVPPQQVSPSPAGPAAAAPQPAPVQQPVQQGGGLGTGAQQATGASAPNGTAGGFGPAASNAAGGDPASGTPTVSVTAGTTPATQPSPVASTVASHPASQPAPQRAMTGFGNVTPEVTAPAPQQATQQPQGPAPGPAPAATPATAPGTVSAFEGSIDERLEALLK